MAKAKNQGDASAVVLPGGVMIEGQISIGAPEERSARIRNDEAEHRRRKDLILFVSVILLLGAVAITCLWIIVRPGHSPDDQNWAVPLLTSIVAGAVSFAFGQATK